MNGSTPVSQILSNYLEGLLIDDPTPYLDSEGI